MDRRRSFRKKSKILLSQRAGNSNSNNKSHRDTAENAAIIKGTMNVSLVALLLLYEACSCVSFQQPSFRRRRTRARALVRRSAMNAKGDNSDPVLRLPLMEAELVYTESEKQRVKLEEEIANAKTAAEFGVRRAQVQFYDAFSAQDLNAMKQVWSASNDVRCVHPGMEAFHGIDDVMKSWSLVFQGEAFTIEPARVKIDICGQTALCSCVEKTPNGGKLEALNVYRREGGSWRMTLHMASPIVVVRASTGL